MYIINDPGFCFFLDGRGTSSSGKEGWNGLRQPSECRANMVYIHVVELAHVEHNKRYTCGNRVGAGQPREREGRTVRGVAAKGGLRERAEASER